MLSRSDYGSAGHPPRLKLMLYSFNVTSLNGSVKEKYNHVVYCPPTPVSRYAPLWSNGKVPNLNQDFDGCLRSYFPCIKHFKYMRLHFITNSRAVIFYLNLCFSIFIHGTNADCRSFRCIFNCIIDQIDQHLQDQPHIHTCKYQFIAFCNDLILFMFPADMP